MTDPYEVLGLPRDAGDEAIRARYLELVRRHTPERDPERFAAVRDAYEALKDVVSRIESRLFKPDSDVVDGAEAAALQSPRRRLGLDALIAMVTRP